MNSVSLLQTLLGPILWLAPLLILVAFLKSPWFKGWLGEAIVRKKAKRSLDPAVYLDFANITIPTSDGTTQIDHIFVSRYGIFVVETKNMSGWIFGDKTQAMWTQVIYKSKKRFQNPMRQNFKHIKSLESMLGVPYEKFRSVIVFAGDSTFKTDMPLEIRKPSDFVEYIQSFKASVLEDKEVADIRRAIEDGRLQPTARVHREHVRHLRAKHRE